MKKIVSLLLVAVLAFTCAACGGKGGNQSSTGNANENKESEISVSIASEPDTIDPALNSTVDGATLLVHLFSGLAKWEENAEGNLEIVADAAESLPEGVVNEDGTVTYTYKLRDGLKWSDGKDLTASDFVFAGIVRHLQRWVLTTVICFEVISGYAEVAETVESG